VTSIQYRAPSIEHPVSSIIENDRPRPGRHPFQVIQELLSDKLLELSDILDETGKPTADE
jgi:hypothetical protein